MTPSQDKVSQVRSTSCLGLPLFSGAERVEQQRKGSQQLRKYAASLQAQLFKLHHAFDLFGRRTNNQFDFDFAEIKDKFLSTYRRDLWAIRRWIINDSSNSGYIKALGGHFKVDPFLYQEDSRYVDRNGKVHQPRTKGIPFGFSMGLILALLRDSFWY
ncbi:hypothetical protein M747DRAFT_308043 [Aspergillus niger ATCC 13496]|uniref:Uncharacterized protein n=1 Tax=Aspergillus niger ATCC 13496 TaxID=1353008 RepID=A0A370BTP5_ASPNG|nr:hypothetical protein M747DRAFT_308043 [Aspergillus niger ATCC 13496]